MSAYGDARAARWDLPMFRNRLEAAVWVWMCDSASAETGPDGFTTSCAFIAQHFPLARQRIRALVNAMITADMVLEGGGVIRPVVQGGSQ